ncbi:hypothetical protein [Dolosigranulum pigrum]|nr:hypothetical protein [Dolosigranulum pigrum]
MRRYNMEILEEKTIFELQEDIDKDMIVELCEEYLIESIEGYYYHHGKAYLPFTIIGDIIKNNGDNTYSCKFSIYRNDPTEYHDPDFYFTVETKYCVELYDSDDEPDFPIHCGEATVFLQQTEEGLKFDEIELLINKQLDEWEEKDPNVANTLLDWYYEPENEEVYLVASGMEYDGDDDGAFEVAQSQDGYIMNWT